jgi:hypothetical protein
MAPVSQLAVARPESRGSCRAPMPKCQLGNVQLGGLRCPCFYPAAVVRVWHDSEFCVLISSCSLSLSRWVTGNLLNTKVLTLVSRQLSQPVQSPSNMQYRPPGTRQSDRVRRALPSTNPYYHIASPHVVESDGIPDVASLQLRKTDYFAASRE